MNSDENYRPIARHLRIMYRATAKSISETLRIPVRKVSGWLRDLPLTRSEISKRIALQRRLGIG